MFIAHCSLLRCIKSFLKRITDFFLRFYCLFAYHGITDSMVSPWPWILGIVYSFVFIAFCVDVMKFFGSYKLFMVARKSIYQHTHTHEFTHRPTTQSNTTLALFTLYYMTEREREREKFYFTFIFIFYLISSVLLH